jgi:Mg-chelatase subunit ChlD
MEDCRTDAIGAVNSFLRQTKADKEVEGRISLITFDSQSIDVIRDKAPAGSCAELEPDEYQPRASTPLLDAVGHGVALLDKAHERDERCVLAVMTDGLENASREYTKDTIKALLERKQKEDGWLIVYLGADHNAWSQAGGRARFCRRQCGEVRQGGIQRHHGLAEDAPDALRQGAEPAAGIAARRLHGRGARGHGR